MTKKQKARPLEVQINIRDAKDWKIRGKLEVSIRGLFRNSGWKVVNHSSKQLGKDIQVEINTHHSGGLAAMVLTPFEVVEEISILNDRDIHRIRVLIDGEEYATKNFQN